MCYKTQSVHNLYLQISLAANANKEKLRLRVQRDGEAGGQKRRLLFVVRNDSAFLALSCNLVSHTAIVDGWYIDYTLCELVCR